MRCSNFSLRHLCLLVLLPGLLAGCEGFFGKKTDKDFIDVPLYNNRAVAYVPIQPVLDGYVYPVDVIAGYDELIYVADAGAEEIVQLDQAGNEIGRFSVPGLKSIAMDRTLDLLAVGTFDTLGTTISAVYRIEQKVGGSYGLNVAFVEKKILHPFYYKVNFNPGVDDLVRIQSIGVRANNDYYVVRSGPNNSTTQFGGPDDAVLIFTDEDQFISPITVSTDAGFFTDYFKRPFGITTLAQPPQSPFVEDAGDFIFTSTSSATTLKVQYITVSETENGVSYTVREMTTGDTSKADGFLYTPLRFGSPADVTYSGDGTNYIFVVDSEKDSLYQFTNTGLEGVAPPAGSSGTKNILVSFGGTGTGLTQFSQPSGVAYLERVLYVADAGNGRVLRFQLTTDFD